MQLFFFPSQFVAILVSLIIRNQPSIPVHPSFELNSIATLVDSTKYYVTGAESQIERKNERNCVHRVSRLNLKNLLFLKSCREPCNKPIGRKLALVENC